MCVGGGGGGGGRGAGLVLKSLSTSPLFPHKSVPDDKYSKNTNN